MDAGYLGPKRAWGEAGVTRKGMEAMNRADGVRATKDAATVLEDGTTCQGNFCKRTCRKLLALPWDTDLCYAGSQDLKTMSWRQCVTQRDWTLRRCWGFSRAKGDFRETSRSDKEGAGVRPFHSPRAAGAREGSDSLHPTLCSSSRTICPVPTKQEMTGGRQRCCRQRGEMEVTGAEVR